MTRQWNEGQAARENEWNRQATEWARRQAENGTWTWEQATEWRRQAQEWWNRNGR